MKFKNILIPALAILAISGCRKMTPAEIVAQRAEEAAMIKVANHFQTTCISGYTFTYNRYAFEERPVQVMDKDGNGISCE